MKQRRRIMLAVCAVAVVAITAMALAGCNNRPSKLFAGEAAKNDGPLSASTVYTQISGENISGNFITGTELVWFTKTDASGSQSFSLYNAKMGTEIIPFTERLSYECEQNSGVVIVTETNVFNNDVIQKFSFYDAEGALMVKDASNTFSESGSGYIVVNETAYLLDGGKLVTSVPVGRGLDQDFLSYDYKSDNYYFSQPAQSDSVKIFGSDGSFIGSVDVTEFETAATNDTEVFYLSSDKIVVQYENVRPDDATRYDYFVYNSKAELKTYIYNVKNGKWSEKNNFKYKILNIVGASELEAENIVYDESITDIMLACEISKKSLSTKESRYSVNKNLKVKVKFDELLDGYAAHVAAEGGGYVLVKADGTQYYYSDNGKTVTPLTGEVVGKYYINGYNSVYKMNDGALEHLKTYSPDISILSICGDYMLISGADGICGCTVGSEPVLLETTGISINTSNLFAGFYIVTDTTGETATYSIYSANGTALRTNLASAVEVVCAVSDGYAIVKSGNEIIRIA